MTLNQLSRPVPQDGFCFKEFFRRMVHELLDSPERLIEKNQILGTIPPQPHSLRYSADLYRERQNLISLSLRSHLCLC